MSRDDQPYRHRLDDFADPTIDWNGKSYNRKCELPCSIVIVLSKPKVLLLPVQGLHPFYDQVAQTLWKSRSFGGCSDVLLEGCLFLRAVLKADLHDIIIIILSERTYVLLLL
jgi:hypothetical protein